MEKGDRGVTVHMAFMVGLLWSAVSLIFMISVVSVLIAAIIYAADRAIFRKRRN